MYVLTIPGAAGSDSRGENTHFVSAANTNWPILKTHLTESSQIHLLETALKRPFRFDVYNTYPKRSISWVFPLQGPKEIPDPEDSDIFSAVFNFATNVLARAYASSHVRSSRAAPNWLEMSSWSPHRTIVTRQSQGVRYFILNEIALAKRLDDK